jgi:TRAP-type mannitol/chloroaromatic compound transport system permease small subunit
MVMRNVDIIVKLGSVVALIVAVILVIFVYALLAYPIEKKCSTTTNKCEFFSKSPEVLRWLINAYVIVTSLLLIAGGVGIFRFALWYQYKNANHATHENGRG